jgi:pseudouridine-5'-phosphate glycosidase
MPFPQNVETAREVEKIIRSKGYAIFLCLNFFLTSANLPDFFLCSAVPATIAILDGVIKVGMIFS